MDVDEPFSRFVRNEAGSLQRSGPEQAAAGEGFRLRQRHQARARTRVTVIAACLCVLAVAAAVLLVQTLGRGRGMSAASVASWRTDTEPNGPGTMSVRYPSSWRVRHFAVTGSFTRGVVAFGNGPFASPCRGNPQVSVSCQGLPHARLAPGGLVVMWYSSAFPGSTSRQLLDRSPGRATMVDHRPAKLAIGRASATCSADGGTTSIEATVADMAGTLTMEACVHGSRAGADEIVASFRSLRITRHHH